LARIRSNRYQEYLVRDRLFVHNRIGAALRGRDCAPAAWCKVAEQEKEFREEKKSHLENELQGLPHEFHFPVGDVWQNLANIIEGRDIDLLILGTHGRTGIGKVLMGSVAETVFRQATCPVLTVGPAVSPRTN
jgi:nucleotide-binding universal stress UspA family protein